ncbi:MAG: nucleotidyltransferase [Cyanobacteria bacterium REEB65]|nr:nucleotidyltransferase [Cyanobacteria bacterium REEB65]
MKPGPQLMLEQRNADQHLLSVGYEATQVLAASKVPHLVGGGIALWAYGRRRNTKDIDLFLPKDRALDALDALARRGFHTRDMDARWLYKAQKSDVTVDIIVFTTGDIRVDERTFAHSRKVDLETFPFVLMGPEDVLYRKIHSTSEERFHDWYDALSILDRRDPLFDWDYFIDLARSNSLSRAVSFLFFARGDLGSDTVPEQQLEALLVRRIRG